MSIHEQIKKSDNIIYQDEELLLVLDIDPISKGHALILPQKSYKDIDDLPKALLNKIMKWAQNYVEVLKEEYHPKGYSIMQNGGDYNDIDVFHLHVFPRFKEEEFGYRNHLSPLEPMALEALKAGLKKELQNG